MPQSALNIAGVQPTALDRRTARAQTTPNYRGEATRQLKAATRPREHLNKHSNSKPTATAPRARRRRPTLTTASK